MEADSRFVKAAVFVAAPLAAEANNRPEDVDLLCQDILETPLIQEAHVAALMLTKLQLDSVELDPGKLTSSFKVETSQRFTPQVQTIASSYLRASLIDEEPLLTQTWKIVVEASRSLGEFNALRGAVAATWWSLVQASTVLKRDPFDTAQSLCLQLALLGTNS